MEVLICIVVGMVVVAVWLQFDQWRARRSFERAINKLNRRRQ
jgi:hypothetical protein